MAEYTGYKINRYIDLNPKSPTYRQTRDERVLDSECSIAQPNWEETQTYCEVDVKGANTGYKIISYTDINTESETFNQTREERVLDTVNCPLPSIDPNWIEDPNFDSYCEEKYYEPSHTLGYTGFKIIRLIDDNIFSPTVNKKVISAITDSETCPPPNTDPILEEISTECEIEEDEFGNLVLNGYSKTIGLDKNVYSETYLQVTTVRQLDANCGGDTCTCDDLTVLDECQCSNLVPIDEPIPPTPTEDFDSMLAEFNEVLSDMNKTQVSSASTPNVYNYLKDGYERALAEYEGNSELFDESYYDEIYNYHGSNTEYHDTAKNAMLSWLMAMQLSELYADSGVTTNTQTELFLKAYNIGGGRSVPVYNSNDMHSDVFIARYAASAIYAIQRANYTFEQMDSLFRSETNTSPIDRLDLSWTNSGQHTEATCDGQISSTNSIGYALNLNDIFPSAAGPYAVNYYNDGLICRNVPTRYPDANQPSSQFNPTTKNYLVDEQIDEIVTTYYNLSANDRDLERAIQAVADDEDDIKQFFGGITYYKYNSSAPKTSFEVGTPTDNMGNFTGTFNASVIGKDLSSLIHNANGTETDISYFFGGVGYIGGESRKTILDLQYGRRRPGQGEGDALYNGDTVVLTSTPRCLCNSSCNTNLNYLVDTSITRLVGGGTKLNSNHYYYVDNNGDGEFDSGEPYYGDGLTGTTDECAGLHASTYPSGHSSEIWTVALFLMQMLPNKYKEIYKAAYDYTVSRTIVRAHWNSDTMYGKLVGTTIVPIINAFRYAHNGQNVRLFYNAAKTMIDNAPSGGGGEIITVAFVVNNNTANNITILNKLSYVLENDNHYEWNECYNIYNFVNDTSRTITIPANGSYTFSATIMEAEDWTTVRHFLNVNNCQSFRNSYPNNSNVLLYDVNGNSSVIIPSNISPTTVLIDGQIYQVYIN